jgi:anti-sigma regulatory factor (Ser/Thr protein kinase)
MTDRIELTLPVEEEFQGIAHLVLGGLAVRLDLTFEHLEDMQLALDGLLERRGDSRVTVAVTVDDGVLRTSVGPFPGGALDELEHDDSSLGLRRILDTVVDSFHVEERDGGHWVQLTKATKATA